MITLTRYRSGNKLFINPAHVSSVASYLKGSIVRFSNGTSYHVAELPDRIMELIRK